MRKRMRDGSRNISCPRAFIVMPRYFFNVRYGEESYRDEVGEELPDNSAAWHEATTSAGQSIRDLNGRLVPGTAWYLEVVCEDGNTLYSIEVKAHQSS